MNINKCNNRYILAGEENLRRIKTEKSANAMKKTGGKRNEKK